MAKEYIAKLIEKKYSSTTESVLVTYKNHQMFIGYFHLFDDHLELKKQLKYRFVPKKNLIAFQEELEKTGKLNPVHTIIIDCSEISEIEFL